MSKKKKNIKKIYAENKRPLAPSVLNITLTFLEDTITRVKRNKKRSSRPPQREDIIN